MLARARDEVEEEPEKVVDETRCATPQQRYCNVTGVCCARAHSEESDLYRNHMDESGFPQWWNVDATSLAGGKRKAKLDAWGVRCTYDLVLVVESSTTEKCATERPETVRATARELFQFCNEELLGMRMRVRQAHKEAGVRVKGAATTTSICATRPDGSHPPTPTPSVATPSEPLPTTMHHATDVLLRNDDVEDDVYGWASSLDAFPPECYCPLTLEVFRDPVLLVSDGYTYERAAVVAWTTKHATSPMTGDDLSTTRVVTNRAVVDWIRRLQA